MMHIKSFTFNNIQENTYILYDDSGSCVIVDPGCYDRDEKDQLTEFIRSHHLEPQYLLNTHCHIDHVLGNQFVKDTYKIPLLIHPIEEEVLRSAKLYAAMYGFPAYQPAEPDMFIEEGHQIKFGHTTLDILFVPGHSPGSVAFVNHQSQSIIAGDVLFYRSIGRSDLPGGHHTSLIRSIRSQLFTLPAQYIVYPGHGPQTNIGDELTLNPYLQSI